MHPRFRRIRRRIAQPIFGYNFDTIQKLRRDYEEKPSPVFTQDSDLKKHPQTKKQRNMNSPKIKPHQEITIHRDGTVSYFSIYLQQWRRISAAVIMNRHDEFASLTCLDRYKINAAFKRLIEA